MNADKSDLVMQIATCNDKSILARVADVLNHRDKQDSVTQAAETRLITQCEAAKRLGVSSTTVWRLIKENSLKAISVRGKQRVQLQSLLECVGVR